MSKLDRRNQARQKQQTKHLENTKALSVFSGRDGAPRNVAVIPLCEGGDASAAIRQLNACLDLHDDVPASGTVCTSIERFKQKIEYIIVQRDLVQALDASRVADFVVFILSADQEVDELGELMLRSIEGQGISTVLTVVQGLPRIEPPKRRPGIIASLKSYITHFFPEQEKVFSLDSSQECSNTLRSICTATPKGVRWREDRSWMLVEDVRWPKSKGVDASDDPSGEVFITGVVRGRRLKADRLCQVGDWGDFQISRITAAPLAAPRKSRTDAMVLEPVDQLLDEPTVDQDDLADLAPEEVAMTDAHDDPVSEAPSERKGVLLDDHHYFSDDETHLPARPKKLPKGTSAYQAAWFLDDVVDSDSDGEDADDIMDQDGDLTMRPPALPQDGVEGFAPSSRREPTELAPSETAPSEMFLDPNPEEEAEALAAFRSRKQNEAEEDLEFPDEIELHPNVLARERLARYRGLKSLRTSHWEVDEDRVHEPEDWRRLLQVENYKGVKSQVLRESLAGGVEVGSPHLPAIVTTFLM